MVAVKKSRSNVIRILWVLVGTIIVSTILFFTLISNGAFGFMRHSKS
jgi:hypothetical protein